MTPTVILTLLEMLRLSQRL